MPDRLNDARKRYAAEYRAKNREHLREYQRNWRKNNPEKVKAIQERFWAKKAAESGSEEGKADQ